MKTLVTMVATGVLSCSLMAVSPAPVLAAEHASSQAKEKKSRVKRTQTLSQQVYKRLEAINELVTNESYGEALDDLQSLEDRRLNSYEKALVLNTKALIYISQEDSAKAIKTYKQMTALEDIPDSLEQGALYNLAGLHMRNEDFEKALVPLNQWFDLVEKPSASAYVLRAQAYFQLDKFNKALPDIKAAIADFKERGKKPRENWLVIEGRIYHHNKDFKSLARCMQDLATYYPKEQYWIQLAAVYAELDQPIKQLSALETAYDKGLLVKESSLVNFASVLLGQDVPYKAGRVLAKGMKDDVVEKDARNLTLLGDAWMAAKEYDKAIVIMAKAAKTSGKGDDYYKLAQNYRAREEWKEALDSVNEALKDDALKARHEALSLKGMVLFRLKRFDAAEKVFAGIVADNPDDPIAPKWLAHVQHERKRFEYMADVQ